MMASQKVRPTALQRFFKTLTYNMYAFTLEKPLRLVGRNFCLAIQSAFASASIMTKSNIILIGMPGAGKSTVGVILAKRIGFHFIDTDLVIQAQEKCRLQQIIDTQGLKNFRKIEEQMLLSLHPEHSIIATGGSVVYSEKGIETLGGTGLLIYIQVSLPALQKRIADMGQRGLVMAKRQTFEQLYQERTPLYEKFANLTIPCNNLNAEQVAAKIEREVCQRWPELTR